MHENVRISLNVNTYILIHSYIKFVIGKMFLSFSLSRSFFKYDNVLLLSIYSFGDLV